LIKIQELPRGVNFQPAKRGQFSTGADNRRFEKTVRSGARPEAVLWTSRSGGRMSNQASIEEAGVICALVINDFPSASSFLARFLSGI
jgi:hypothetical protein